MHIQQYCTQGRGGNAASLTLQMKRKIRPGGPACPPAPRGLRRCPGGSRGGGFTVWQDRPRRGDPHTASLYCALRDR